MEPRMVGVGRLALAIGVAAGCWACTAEPGTTRPLVLVCDYGGSLQDVYLMEPETNRAQLLSVSPSRPGSLSTDAVSYALSFEEDRPAPGYQQLLITVNRYTSKAERSIGREQKITYEGRELELHVQRDTGVCEVRAKPLF